MLPHSQGHEHQRDHLRAMDPVTAKLPRVGSLNYSSGHTMRRERVKQKNACSHNVSVDHGERGVIPSNLLCGKGCREGMHHRRRQWVQVHGFGCMDASAWRQVQLGCEGRGLH